MFVECTKPQLTLSVIAKLKKDTKEFSDKYLRLYITKQLYKQKEDVIVRKDLKK